MKGPVEAVKDILVGGVLFLIPLAVIVLVAVQILKFLVTVATPMASFLPTDTVLGVGLANILAGLALLVLSFLAGLAARVAFTRRAVGAIEETVLGNIPGYGAVKQFAEAMIYGAEAVESFIPVSVEYVSVRRPAFEVERVASGRVVVYFPNTPNVWSGFVGLVEPERVEALDIEPGEMIGMLEQLGVGWKAGA